MNDHDQVVVRWTNQGALWKDGVAYSRSPGNQDVMDYRTARAIERSGRLVIQGLASETVEVIEDVHELDALQPDEDS